MRQKHAPEEEEERSLTRSSTLPNNPGVAPGPPKTAQNNTFPEVASGAHCAPPAPGAGGAAARAAPNKPNPNPNPNPNPPPPGRGAAGAWGSPPGTKAPFGVDRDPRGPDNTCPAYRTQRMDMQGMWRQGVCATQQQPSLTESFRRRVALVK